MLNMKSFEVSRTGQLAQFGDILLDFRKMELRRSGQRVALTLREFRALKFLVCRPDVVISRRRLISAVWPKRERSGYRSVDNCIVKLRRKIESNPECPVFIRTVHGIGYKFVPEASAPFQPERELRNFY